MKAFQTALILGIVIGAVSFSQALTIKVGSIAPDGSPWDMALKKMTTEWTRISNGQLQFKIYPGGIVGSENDMVRKMRIGQIQAAVFTGIGMGYIAPEVIALNLPFLVENDDELDYLMARITPYFDELIEKKGFHVAGWAKSGWVHFFSTKKALTPDEMKPLALGTSEGDPDMLQAWRAIGFNAVALSTNETMTALQSGMIEAYYSTPLASAAFQWFALAQHMSDFKVAPLLGGFVLDKKTWDKIPDDIKPELKKTASKIFKEMYIDILKLEDDAIAVMKKNGLQIHHMPKDVVEQWHEVSVKGYNIYIGKTFPRSLYTRLQNIINEYRSKKNR